MLHFITNGRNFNFSMKYVTLEVMNVKEGREESTLASFIISKQEHMIISERIKEVSELTEPGGDAYYVDLLSEAECYSNFGKDCDGGACNIFFCGNTLFN